MITGLYVPGTSGLGFSRMFKYLAFAFGFRAEGVGAWSSSLRVQGGCRGS